MTSRTELTRALRLALAELDRWAAAPATDQVQSHYDNDTEAARSAARAALAEAPR